MPIITKIDLLKERRTKIIATLGPSSNDVDTIKQLIQAGANMFRLNMSHGNHQTHRKLFFQIRDIAASLQQLIPILADLCGPKIRIGRFKGGKIELIDNSNVVITTRNVEGESGLIPSQYRALAEDVESGDRILLDDGNIELRVEKIKHTDIDCKVIHGGVLKDNKGMNLPGVNVSAPALTEKDRLDALFAIDLGVDFLALSFVRQASDLIELRSLVEENGGNTALIAKIEKPEALENGREILNAADGIMIARGDLGVELALEEVPTAQQQLVDRARAVNKPVIVATQMLESMMDNPRPTRAEVTDISYAVSSGTDAVMLSGESAAGAYPVKAVEMMARIIKQTEAYIWRRHDLFDFTNRSTPHQTVSFGDALAKATAKMAYDLPAKIIMVVSQSGMSAATISAARPTAPIVALSSSENVCRRMSLSWGIIPLLEKDAGSINPNQIARKIALQKQFADQGDYVLLVRGFNSDPELNTPSVTVLQV